MLGGCADENKKNPSTIQDVAGINGLKYTARILDFSQ
jgi:hypothetical protein